MRVLMLFSAGFVRLFTYVYVRARLCVHRSNVADFGRSFQLYPIFIKTICILPENIHDTIMATGGAVVSKLGEQTQ